MFYLRYFFVFTNGEGGLQLQQFGLGPAVVKKNCRFTLWATAYNDFVFGWYMFLILTFHYQIKIPISF